LVWFQRNSGSTSTLHGAAYGSGKYVVVGEQGTVLTSIDGVQWSAQSTGLPALNDIAFGAGQFVAVGTELSIASSTNGVDWTLTTLPAPSDAACCARELTEITYGNGAFMTTGYYQPRGRLQWAAVLGFSTDGKQWRTATNPPLAYSFYRLHPAAGLGQFLLAGASLYSSTDGESWIERIAGTYFPVLAVGPDRSVALSDSGLAATSTDAIHWNLAPADPPLTGDVMAAGGDAFVTAWRGNGPTMFATSAEGGNWSIDIMVELTLYLTDSKPFLASGANCFVAGGRNGTILQSSPLVLPPHLSLAAGAQANGLLLRLSTEPGTRVLIQTSNNLVDWTDWKNTTVQQETTEIELSTSDELGRFYRAVTP
jgi:hypothetical protein